MGWPEIAVNGQKSQEQSDDHGGRRRRFASPIWARPGRLAVKFCQRDCPEVAHLLVRRCTITPVGGASSGPISHSFPMSKRSNSVPSLESSFLGFLEFKKCLGG